MDRLARFLAATEAHEHSALRALTLHMLNGLTGSNALLPDALERCAHVTFDFSDPETLQSSIDAWFCRHVHGLPHPRPNAFKLGEALRRFADDHLIYSWVLGELAARCGVDVRLSIRERPYQGTSRLHDTYWLTHLPMLHTDYFMKPVTQPNTWADELEAAVPWLANEPNEDLAGEVALCLKVLKRDASAALALLPAHRLPDEPHAQATALLAFAAR
jgi:D-amino peptidase